MFWSRKKKEITIHSENSVGSGLSDSVENFETGKFGLAKKNSANHVMSIEEFSERMDSTYDEAIKQLDNITCILAKLAAEKAKIEQESFRLRAVASEYDAKARKAVKEENESYAKEMLEGKQKASRDRITVISQAEEIGRQLLDIKTQQETMRIQVEQFATKKETIKIKYETLLASEKANELYIQLTEQKQQIDEGTDALEEKALQMKAKAEALIELQNQGIYEDLA